MDLPIPGEFDLDLRRMDVHIYEMRFQFHKGDQKRKPPLRQDASISLVHRMGQVSAAHVPSVDEEELS